MLAELKTADLNHLRLGDYGLIVAEHCTLNDFEMFERFLRSGSNPTFPRRGRLAFIDHTIYLKSIPSSPNELAKEYAMAEFIDMNLRIGNRKALESTGSRTLSTGVGDSRIEADGGIRLKGRLWENLFIEVNGIHGDTTRLIRVARLHMSCEKVRYCLAIDILPFVEGNIENKQAQILVHLFEKDSNNSWAPISITSIGNMPNPSLELNLHHLFHTHYPGYVGIDSTGHVVARGTVCAGMGAGAIVLRGIGFDPSAPPCNDTEASRLYYRLFFNPNLLFEGDTGFGIINTTGFQPQQVAQLEHEAYIELYPILMGVRQGFFDDRVFSLPMDQDML